MAGSSDINTKKLNGDKEVMEIKEQAMEIKELERRIAPIPLRAQAGFAKTHGRISPFGWISQEDLEDIFGVEEENSSEFEEEV